MKVIINTSDTVANPAALTAIVEAGITDYTGKYVISTDKGYIFRVDNVTGQFQADDATDPNRGFWVESTIEILQRLARVEDNDYVLVGGETEISSSVNISGVSGNNRLAITPIILGDEATHKNATYTQIASLIYEGGSNINNPDAIDVNIYHETGITADLRLVEEVSGNVIVESLGIDSTDSSNIEIISFDLLNFPATQTKMIVQTRRVGNPASSHVIVESINFR